MSNSAAVIQESQRLLHDEEMTDVVNEAVETCSSLGDAIDEVIPFITTVQKNEFQCSNEIKIAQRYEAIMNLVSNLLHQHFNEVMFDTVISTLKDKMHHEYMILYTSPTHSLTEQEISRIRFQELIDSGQLKIENPKSFKRMFGVCPSKLQSKPVNHE